MPEINFLESKFELYKIKEKEREGFEPSLILLLNSISNAAP